MAAIVRQVTVVRDGLHNAFTDLQFWQGCYWVGYRKGAGHVSMDGQAAVSMSADRNRFREAARLHVPGDNRDPKLFPVDEDRIALHVASWTHGAAKRHLQQYISFSQNGTDWGKPCPILGKQMWLWRVRRHDNRYYGLIQNLDGSWDGQMPHNLDLAVSSDLLEWKTIARVGEGLGLNESDIFWQEDGEAWIVARSVVKPGGSFFCTARPPYTNWETTELSPMVHAPVFLHHNGELYVAGRCQPRSMGNAVFPFPGCSLGVWRVKRGFLEPVLHIPAVGDCSYPGMIKDSEGRICLTYYSQHAYYMGVLGFSQATDMPAGVVCAPDSVGMPADVYFLELKL
jgi:hypothetical protein